MEQTIIFTDKIYTTTITPRRGSLGQRTFHFILLNTREEAEEEDIIHQENARKRKKKHT